MTWLSPRLLLNLVFAHLARNFAHEEGCNDEGCNPECDWRGFLEWLDAPLMPWDVRMHERMRERISALERGEIPA